MRVKLIGLTLAATVALALPAAAMSGSAGTRPTLQVKSSRFGPVLFDGRGFVLYAFTKDPRARSACYGACARAWPVYYAPRGTLRAGKGVKRALIGTTKRRDGRRQVTYGGRPLYYYVGDRRPGDITCQNIVEFGGTWLIVRGSAKLVR